MNLRTSNNVLTFQYFKYITHGAQCKLSACKIYKCKKNVSDKVLGLDRWATITLSEI